MTALDRRRNHREFAVKLTGRRALSWSWVWALLLPLLAVSIAGCAHRLDGGNAGSTPAAASPDRPAWMPAPLTSMAYSSRVGIMTVLDNELAQVTAGTAGIGNGSSTIKPTFDYPGYVSESLRKGILAHTPYQPVLVRPSARLIRDKRIWQQTWNKDAGKFETSWQHEFDAVIKQNQLKLLIVVTAPEEDDGIVGTSQTITGSGYYARSFLGRKQTAVFSTVHFYRIAGQPGKLLHPVSAPAERLYADLPDFPNPAPQPLSQPLQIKLEKAVKDMIDQKVGAFISMMK